MRRVIRRALKLQVQSVNKQAEGYCALCDKCAKAGIPLMFPHKFLGIVCNA